MRDIGMILSTSRKKAGYTQQQLAEELKKRGIEISFRFHFQLGEKCLRAQRYGLSEYVRDPPGPGCDGGLLR
jgi:transcriptional regulator with XRE-family HTH domain